MNENITTLLKDYQSGQKSVEGKLFSEVESGLRKIAINYMRREDSHHTLQPTALVNELYLKIEGHDHIDWQNRAHFFAIAATLMRRILIDHARAKKAEKRGGEATHLTLSAEQTGKEDRSAELMDLENALQELEKLNARQARIVELKFFAGLNIEEIAEVTESSTATVKRDWAFAKAWLFKRLSS